MARSLAQVRAQILRFDNPSSHGITDVTMAASLYQDPISLPARKDPDWIGQRFYLRGEDRDGQGADRVRVGFATDGVRGLSEDLAMSYNWSMAQRPGDHAQDLGFGYTTAWRRNRIGVRGRLHEYSRTVTDAGRDKRVSGEIQTLDMTVKRSLYSARGVNLNTAMVISDYARRSHENGRHKDTTQRRYSTLKMHGKVQRHIAPLGLDAHAGLSLESCVGMLDGDDQEACGDRMGQFHRYTLSTNLTRPLWDWQWRVRGRYQHTPGELPSSRYLKVGGSSMMHGFANQTLRGSRGGWLRLDTESAWHPLSQVLGLRSSVRFSVLQGWVTDLAAHPDTPGSASAAEIMLRLKGERMSAGIQVGTMLGVSGPDYSRPDLPDLSLSLSLTL